MATVSFQVVDGVDKGRCFQNLDTPITLGREEGNSIRLNDERVSRFHAKVQEDQGQVVLTDLDSTNGTCVNGEPVQLRLLRAGDRISVGRSVLIFGTADEIREAVKEPDSESESESESELEEGASVSSGERSAKKAEKMISAEEQAMITDMTFNMSASTESGFDIFEKAPPRLPNRLSPAQAAQLSEVVDFLHRALASSVDHVQIPQGSKEARIPLGHWHRIQMILSFLARYSRSVSEPDEQSRNEE